MEGLNGEQTRKKMKNRGHIHKDFEEKKIHKEEI